jgi:hypothetical protein
MKKAFFIFLIYLISSYSYIIIPFQELEIDDIYEFKDVEQLLNELSYLKLYSEFYMGFYTKMLPVFFKKDVDFFYLGELNEDKLKNADNYKTIESSSLKKFEDEKYYSLIEENDYKRATETINFLMTEGDIKTIYKDENGQIEANNYLKFENIKLFIPYKDYKYINFQYYAGYMGFAYPNNKYYDKTNFLKELKDKALINKTIWSVQFPDIDEDTIKKGNIVIGEYPHIYEPNYYKEEQYLRMKIPEMYNNNTEHAWKLNVDSASILKLYYENTDKKEIGLSCDYIKSISIEFGLYMMYAPKKLFDQLKELYFENLFDKGICDYKKIKTDEDKIIIVYCDKDLFEVKDQMEFPKIIFDIQKLGGNFELTYKEVFMTKNNKVYLMIAFSSKQIVSNIKLGQIFLYKYQFTFDYDNREIGVYRNDLSSQKVAHRIKRAFRGKQLFVYFILVAIVIGLCYCYKKGYILKKKAIDYNTVNKNIEHFTGEDIEQGYELRNE